ncbi:uncharacterized protein LOC131854345 [Achroia grisella]|uniref:uncharacterized protein LOC131854345 n=1 Tax=Achroia grisella TaxID=688607 RepID=UPI0027D22DF8|nr:uncharacterized protein LOC131854345 [Achroia grisella]
MSSDSSIATNTSSRIRQFGLYRTIDARTEEFLKLSRKRQIRQGCACAVISTAITVAIVVVILLIYEYAIAVEWSLVQNKKPYHRRSNNTIIVNDTPVADRLDRSYFGFDQDYYERMPLLVNAMQENSYVDPSIDTTIQKRGKNIDMIYPNPKITTNEAKYENSIRRTSPRPFIYEQRSPTPVPFSKTFRSKSWVESYRNAERLKNIQQVIKYLEKTINAKVGDMHGLSPSTQIAFSGVYVEPYHHDNKGPKQPPSIDLLLESSNNIETIKSSHQSDPLFKYKPDNPSDVNLLADSYLRFLPTATPTLFSKEYPKVPMFRPIPVPSQKKPFDLLQSSSLNNNFNTNENNNKDKAKTFSVMLNLYPLLPSLLDTKAKRVDFGKTTQSVPNKIYITTSRPLFRRKSIVRRTSVSSKRPRIFNNYKTPKYNEVIFSSKDKTDHSDSEGKSNMIVQVNVYQADKTSKLYDKTENSTEFTINNNNQKRITPVTDVPIQLSTTQVEDRHLGSSGVLPVQTRSEPPPSLPIVTTMIPFFDITPTTTNTWVTNPPDIIKFSHEDAKIPDQYINMQTNNFGSDAITIDRRSFTVDLDSSEKESEKRTLVVKLKNNSENVTEETTTHNKIKEETTTENIKDTTTKEYEIRHTNGHYRNKFIAKQWLDPNSEANRKRRLQLLAKGFRRPSFNSSYVEIDRSNSQKTD